MKVQDILVKLVEVASTSNDEAKAIAQDAIDLTNQYKSGKLCQSEYQELVGDLALEKLILIKAAELNLKQELNALFSAIESAVLIFA